MIYKVFNLNDLRRAGLVLLLTCVFSAMATGQTVGQESREPVAAKTDDEIQARIRQLEAQVLAMQTELERIKRSLSEHTTSVKAAEPAKTETAKTNVAAPTAKDEAKAQAAPKQTGIDLGNVRLTPYGTIYFGAFNNSGAVNNQDVPLFAAATGQSGFGASLRQTRLGLRIEGAKVGNARLGGVIEADFFGGFPTVGIGENFGIVRIRLANAKLDWEKTSVVIGQDWMPFAPVSPTSIAAAAIPQLAAAGNNWARIPQVRVDHKFKKSVTWTAAILAPQTGDYPTSPFFLQPNSGMASHVPFFQSRLAFSDPNWLGTKRAGSVGLSGHYGRSRVVTGSTSIKNDVDSVGVALDWSMPLHPRLAWSGEAFFGRDLGGFQAGIFQSLNTDFAYRNGSTVVPGGVRAIGTRGGWTQLGFTPDGFKEKWSLYGSIGIDDPDDDDLTSISRFNFRSRNLVYAFNTVYKVTPQFWLGAEFRGFYTRYFISGKRTSEHIYLGATYSF